MSRLTPADREALSSKMTTRLDRLLPERRRLEAAMAEISHDFDLQTFIECHGSERDRDINKVRAVERNFEILHNYLCEVVRFGLELSGSRSRSDPPNAPRDFDDLRRSGVLSKRQVTALIKLHAARSGLQHWYTEVEPADTHRAILELITELVGISSALKAWQSALVS